MQGYNRVACEQRYTLLETERAWLAALQPDLVVSDVVPLACAAAAAAGVRCVCVSNFSWDFVYSECAAGPRSLLLCCTKLVRAAQDRSATRCKGMFHAPLPGGY